MKIRDTFLAAGFVLTACSAPVHDDPDETDQVANFNGLWASLKDFHFESKHNDYIDNLITNGDPANDLNGLVTENAPGCAIGVLHENDITYLQTYGYSTEFSDWNMATITPVASISKTITAIAIMRMVEEGMMNLDTPVNQYVGDAGVFNGITIAELLSLDAGVPPGSPPWDTTPSCPISFPASATTDWCLSHPRVAIHTIKNDLTLGPQADKYSNMSIMAAAAALDQISYDEAQVDDNHRGYEAWVWHQLGHWAGNHSIKGEFTSMALTHSWRENDIINYADGFDCNGGCGMNPPLMPAWLNAGDREGWWGPAGGWAMTIGDLARFAAIINTNDILTKQIGNNSWNELFVQLNDVFDDIPGDDYGLGTIVENWSGIEVAGEENPDNEKIVWHGGDLYGYASVWYYSEIDNESYAVVMQCNGASAESSSFQLKEYAKNIIAYARAGGDIHGTLDVTTGFASPDQAAGEYILDPDATYLASPQSLHIPLLLDNELLFSVETEGQDLLDFTVQEVTLASDGTPVPTNSPAIMLGSYTYRPNRKLTTQPLDIALQVNNKSLPLEHAVFNLGFAKQGTHIAESAINGVLDLRNLDRFGLASNWQQLCSVSDAQDGISCQPCADDTRACLPLTWNTQAVRLSPRRE